MTQPLSNQLPTQYTGQNFALVLLTDWLQTNVEIWKPIKGFVGYDISSLGNVRTYWKTSSKGRGRGGWCQILTDSPRLRQPATDKDGYKTIALRRDGQGIAKRVHRLVADAFIVNNRPHLITVPNHINNVPYDNRYDNLSWMTISENTLYGNDIGTGNRGETHGMARLTEGDVREIRAQVKCYADKQKYAAILGCTYQNIDRILKRRTWQHIQ